MEYVPIKLLELTPELEYAILNAQKQITVLSRSENLVSSDCETVQKLASDIYLLVNELKKQRVLE